MPDSSARAFPPSPHPNSYWVESRLLAGEYPAAGDARAARVKLQGLLDAGINCFIDLTSAEDGLFPYAPLLPSGVAYRRFPIRDFDVPHSAAQMVEILDTIEQQLAAGCMVYVHCWGGVGRTGTVIGSYLARRGWRGEAALQELGRLWQGCALSSSCATPETVAQREWILNWRG